MPKILYFFALCNLIIGSGAFVLAGILQPLASSLNVRLGAAGQVMTAYALTTAVVAPLLIIATAAWPRKRAVELSLALFTLGCLMCALAPNLGVLLLGRVVMGTGAMFSSVASAVAVTLVAPALRGRALSITFLGISVSYAVALPVGAWLGFSYGWQTPMWVIAAGSVLVLIAARVLLPNNMAAAGASFSGIKAAALLPAVQRTWARTLLYFVAIFSVFGYIGPVLTALNKMPPGALALTLAVFGLAGVAGTLVGGWANDRFGFGTTMRLLLGVLCATMLVLPFTQGSLPATLAVLVVWGVAGFGLMAPQQGRLASLVPAQAPLLLSLNASMLYIGTALGTLVSGAAVDAVGLARLSWVGLPFALLAWLTLVFDRAPASADAAVAAGAETR